MTIEKSILSIFARALHCRLMVAAVLAVTLIIAGCVSTPPRRPDNACKIFAQKPSWHKHTRRAAKKWRADAAVLLAIMRQESGFDANARPKRKRFLGIPLKRPSSAFGYAQALDGTWRLYKKSAGSFLAQRDRFSDAMDFIGWYVAQTRKRLNIPAHDGYRNYLAYHEGWQGYARGTYKRKKWLISTAKRVAHRAAQYRAQLARCG
ncbi:transglycosylase SLT domain-containing protein [Candidatus Spongiihabitans sp.]|uniref:transglycosylase SLT domain-containing protein n=1 Tax=Candidatus Spongiihabitans sp. TaxID=3101308 RepID=UPI003C7B507D